jgi:hypothetical protein
MQPSVLVLDDVFTRVMCMLVCLHCCNSCCMCTALQAPRGKKGSQKSTNNASNGNTAAATAAAASTKSATAASDKAAAAASKAEALAERLEGLKLEKQAWAVGKASRSCSNFNSLQLVCTSNQCARVSPCVQEHTVWSCIHAGSNCCRRLAYHLLLVIQQPNSSCTDIMYCSYLHAVAAYVTTERCQDKERITEARQYRRCYCSRLATRWCSH